MRRTRTCTFALTMLVLFIQPLHTTFAQLLNKVELEFMKGAESARTSCVRVDVERKTVRQGFESLGKSPGTEGGMQESSISLSGLILDQEGHVATVAEALEGAHRVWISQFDGEVTKRFKADVVGYSLDSNVGLLRISNALPLKALPLGDSDSVRQGSLVMGVGYTFNQGASPTFTVGIVNATDRVFKMSTSKGSTRVFFQTSLSIHPGESGGPMVNTSMEVVGLLLTRYQPYNPSPEAEPGKSGFTSSGCTLVMPINTVKKEAALILTRQNEATAATKVSKEPWLGLTGQEIFDKGMRNRLQIPEGGILVSYVFPDDPAHKAGISKNDVLKAWNNIRIMGLDHFRELIGATKVGDRVRIMLIREGKEQKVEVLIGSF